MEQNSNYSSSEFQREEVTLKELILKVRGYYFEVINNFKTLLLITIPSVVLMVVLAWLTPPIYPATLTFMVISEEGGGFNSISAVLGQFGIGGGGGGGKNNLDRILELSKSRKIVQQALFESVNLKNIDDYLANHIIKDYDFHEEWEEDTTGLKGFLFKHKNVEKFNRTENKVLKKLHGHIIGSSDEKGIMSNSYGEDTGIMSITTNANSESLSIVFTETIFRKLSEFYVTKTVEKQTKTYDIFKAKVDSLQIELNNAQYRLLRFKDSNRNLGLSQYKTEEYKLEQEIQKLILSYGEAYKNLEFTDFALKNKTPFVQEIDLPIPPILPRKQSKVKAVILGGVLGGFLGLAFIIGRKLFREIMEN